MCRYNRQSLKNIFLILLLGAACWGGAGLAYGQVFSRQRRGDEGEKGQTLIKNKEWSEAVEYYQMYLIKEIGTSKRDDFQFWLAYALEHISGREEEAFEAYGNLLKFHASSRWADDGRVHQVMVARQLVASGKLRYVDFLVEKLNAPQKQVRFHAAFALAVQRHISALPILVEAAAQSEVQIVRDAVQALKNYNAVTEAGDGGGAGSTEFMAGLSQEDIQLIRERLRKPNSGWNKTALLLNGLFHIITPEQLVHYLKLEQRQSREAWWYRFWKSKDPTPTTDRNEALVEFERRVDYVFTHFSRDWDMVSRGYPPWDTRGEVYIRLGEPDETIDAGQAWEEWSYYPRRLILYVDGKAANSAGEGISTSGVTQYLNALLNKKDGSSMRLTTEPPEFHYRYPVSPKMKNMDILMEKTGESKNEIELLLNFCFPASELRLLQVADKRRGLFLLSWVVMDAQYNECARDEVSQEVLLDRLSVDQGLIEVLQSLHLPLGRYVIAVQLEDQKSVQFGIFKKMFRVVQKVDGTLVVQ